jgi:hypothetical protein
MFIAAVLLVVALGGVVVAVAPRSRADVVERLRHASLVRVALPIRIVGPFDHPAAHTDRRDAVEALGTTVLRAALFAPDLVRRWTGLGDASPCENGAPPSGITGPVESELQALETVGEKVGRAFGVRK